MNKIFERTDQIKDWPKLKIGPIWNHEKYNFQDHIQFTVVEQWQGFMSMNKPGSPTVLHSGLGRMPAKN